MLTLLDQDVPDVSMQRQSSLTLSRGPSVMLDLFYNHGKEECRWAQLSTPSCLLICLVTWPPGMVCLWHNSFRLDISVQPLTSFFCGLGDTYGRSASDSILFCGISVFSLLILTQSG